ncbi:MAG: M20 family metallopeptidase [Limnochordaceae bacterium]|nr:M20 family metallopeptidase [Limnochordaceae bacterium]
MVEEMRRLVEVETPSGDEQGIATAAALLAGRWRRLGCRVDQYPAPGVGVHLAVHIPGRGEDGGQGNGRYVLVLGHVDTVHPRGTLAATPFRVQGDRAWGPGTYDMKGALVMMAWAVQALRAVGSGPRHPVTLLLTADEEVGSHTSRPLIDRFAGGATCALVLEPAAPGGAVKTARKGVAQYRLSVTGRSAHAGNDFSRGINANVALARLVLAAASLSDPERGTTVNVGVIGGGTRPNVVAERAWADIDVRFTTRAEAERIDRALRALTADGGTVLEVSGGVNRWPLERTASAGLYEHARSLAASLGLQLPEAQVGGASDGNLTAELGLPTLDGLGPEGDGAHSSQEHVYLPSLPVRTALLALILETL